MTATAKAVARAREARGWVGVDHEWWRELPRGEVPASALGAAPLRRTPVFSSPDAHKCTSSRKREGIAYALEIERLTSGPRCAMAARLRARSGRSGLGTTRQAERSKWHEDRIRGLAERANRLLTCGVQTGVFEGYTKKQERLTCAVKQRCGDAVLCRVCAWRRRQRLASGVTVQVPAARAARRMQMSMYYKGPEGRWSEKMLTLTTPHSGCPVTDARLIKRAWRIWTRKVEDHLRKDRGAELAPIWLRTIEAAAAGTGVHMHQHVWWLGPYLEHAVARHLWGQALVDVGASGVPEIPRGEALSKAIDARAGKWLQTRRGANGRPLQTVRWPHVYIEKANADSASKYVAKLDVSLYVTKGSEVMQMEPLHAAAAWHALKVVRSIAWSRGWAPARPAVQWSWHYIRRMTPEEIGEAGQKEEKRIDAARAPPLAS